MLLRGAEQDRTGRRPHARCVLGRAVVGARREPAPRTGAEHDGEAQRLHRGAHVVHVQRAVPLDDEGHPTVGSRLGAVEGDHGRRHGLVPGVAGQRRVLVVRQEHDARHDAGLIGELGAQGRRPAVRRLVRRARDVTGAVGRRDVQERGPRPRECRGEKAVRRTRIPRRDELDGGPTTAGAREVPGHLLGGGSAEAAGPEPVERVEQRVDGIDRQVPGQGRRVPESRHPRGRRRDAPDLSRGPPLEDVGRAHRRRVGQRRQGVEVREAVGDHVSPRQPVGRA